MFSTIIDNCVYYKITDNFCLEKLSILLHFITGLKHHFKTTVNCFLEYRNLRADSHMS